MEDDRLPVVIIGGGISGLAAAYDLAKANIPHLLIDKGAKPGGLIQTERWYDCVLEYGPDSFISQKPEALALIKDNLDDALDIDYPTALHREAERLVRASRTADHKEAVAAFVEKRKPKFVGA